MRRCRRPPGPACARCQARVARASGVGPPGPRVVRSASSWTAAASRMSRVGRLRALVAPRMTTCGRASRDASRRRASDAAAVSWPSHVSTTSERSASHRGHCHSDDRSSSPSTSASTGTKPAARASRAMSWTVRRHCEASAARRSTARGHPSRASSNAARTASMSMPASTGASPQRSHTSRNARDERGPASTMRQAPRAVNSTTLVGAPITRSRTACPVARSSEDLVEWRKRSSSSMPLVCCKADADT